MVRQLPSSRLAPNGQTYYQVIRKMKATYKKNKNYNLQAYYNLRTGPSNLALKMVKKMRRGYMPKWASERGSRFISVAADGGYGAGISPSNGALLDGEVAHAIEMQDENRRDRLPSEFMFRAMHAADATGDLVLPGDSNPEIVSVAATRALGYAPQIAPPAMIQLGCKYQMGDRPDMAIELDTD